MSVDKYKFVSPGVFVSEIDNTGRSAIAGDIGPALIGRAEKGPMLKPTQIDSMADFVNVFGNPIPGAKGGDVARDGNYTSPTYAPYAAQAWFRNNSPVTFVRLGGQAHAQASDDGGKAGWQTTDSAPGTSYTDNGGAYGLFVADAPAQVVLTASLSSSVVLDAAAYLQIRATGSDGNVIERFFVSGTSNATSDATIMTFSGSDNHTLQTTAITTVINLSSLPITANAYTNTVGLTASALFPTLATPGIDLSPKFSTGMTLKVFPTTGLGLTIPTLVTGTMSASYSATTGTLAAVWYIEVTRLAPLKEQAST